MVIFWISLVRFFFKDLIWCLFWKPSLVDFDETIRVFIFTEVVWIFHESEFGLWFVKSVGVIHFSWRNCGHFIEENWCFSERTDKYFGLFTKFTGLGVSFIFLRAILVISWRNIWCISERTEKYFGPFTIFRGLGLFIEKYLVLFQENWKVFWFLHRIYRIWSCHRAIFGAFPRELKVFWCFHRIYRIWSFHRVIFGAFHRELKSFLVFSQNLQDLVFSQSRTRTLTLGT